MGWKQQLGQGERGTRSPGFVHRNSGSWAGTCGQRKCGFHFMWLLRKSCGFGVPQEPCGVLCRVQNLRVLLQALAAASLSLLGGRASVGPHKWGQGGALGEPLGAWQWCQWLCRNRVLSAPGWPGLALLSPGCPRGTGTPWPLVTFNGSTPLRLRAN